MNENENMNNNNVNEEEVKEEEKQRVFNEDDDDDFERNEIGHIELFHKSGFYGKSTEHTFEIDSPKIVIISLLVIWLIAMVVGIILIVKFFNNEEATSAYIAIGILVFITCVVGNQIRLNIKKNKNK